jgi:uncharacterized repeat protein (TIGR01451 family)/LPXTG-motif cell wall-anchored protein
VRVGVGAILVGAAVLVAGQPVTPALAADGDARPELTEKNVLPAAAIGGDTLQYSINYTCSNSHNEAPVDGCDGAVFTDPIPTFTNIYGVEMPLEFVSVTTTDVFPDLHLDATNPAAPFLTGVAATWTPGTSGTVFVALRVPVGMVPPGTTDVLTNVATVTDPVAPPDDSTAAVTTISAQTPHWEVTKLGPDSPTRMNREQSWTISVCGDAEAALWPAYEITDTLPPGLTYETADENGVYTDDPADTTPDNTSDGAGTVTWTFDAARRPPLGTDGCFRLHLTGRFPSGYVAPVGADHPNADNVGGAVKINTVTGTGSDPISGASEGLGVDPEPLTLLAPNYFGTGIAKDITTLAGADNQFVQDGDTGRFNLAVDLDTDLPVEQVVLTDGTWEFDDGVTTDSGTGLPESFTATQLDPGTWTGGLSATILGSDDDFATAGVVIGVVASNAAVIDLAPTFRSFRWVWGDGTPGAVPADFAANGIQIIGTFGAPGVTTFGDYTNIARVDTTFNGDVDTHTSRDDYVLETPLPLPSITKTIDNGERRPGQTATYTVHVENDADATGTLVDPMMQDCIPAYLVLQGAPAATGWLSGPAPTCAADETPVGYTFDGTLTPGQAAPDITFTVVVAAANPGPIAPYGLYTNTAFVRPSGGGNFGHCVQSDPIVCGSSADLIVLPTVSLESQKCVAGDLDAGVFRPSPTCSPGEPAVVSAQTLPGGGMTWRLQLRNVGNTAATNIEFVDLFPRRNDTAVISTTNGVLNQRNSEWDPILVSLISAEPGWTVSYSTSVNPCRGEVGGPTSGCDAPNWTTTPALGALSSYRSIRLSYAGSLAIGASSEFEWEMRAPVLDPANYDKLGVDAANPYEFLMTCESETPSSNPNHCPRAVNSFAYGADAAGLPVGVPQPSRLFAEPPQVDVRVVGPPRPNAIGDRVWFDRDYDGLQGDPSAGVEPGIPGVRVELWEVGGTEPVDVTYTDANGNYLFAGDVTPLADGDYVVRIHPPTGYYLSPQDRSGPDGDAGAPDPGTNPGANTDDDSDFDPVERTGGTIPGTYFQTPVVHLGDNDNTDVGGPTQGETDRTWDAGLWRALPEVGIVKITKDTAWADSAAGDGVLIVHGRPVTWIYTITNPGNTRLEDVTITDDGGGASAPDFAVSDCTITDDGTNANGTPSSATAPIALNRSATMRCTVTGAAGTTPYNNIATVVGNPVTDDGEDITSAPPGFPPVPDTLNDSDPSSYVAGIYDLALAKTVGAVDYATGNVAFTITVRNQGTVGSGDYTVTDVLPDGMTVLSTTPLATTSAGQPDGTTVLTWNRSGLAPSANHTFTINAHIDDYLLKPFRNSAWISADGSAQVVTGNGVATPTSDVDSLPTDADTTVYGPIGTPDPAADNANIGEASTDPQGGEDDADIADINPAIVYDLALAKVAVTTPIPLGQSPTFTVRVYNQGNVPSGPVSVLDQIPTGLTFNPTGSTDECADAFPVAPNRIECDIANIAPGAFADLTIATTILQTGGVVDHSTAPWRNWAEISDDSANEIYGADVADADSDPESESTNGIGADDTLPGDPYTSVTAAGATYSGPATGDEDDNDDAVVAGPTYDLAVAKTVGTVDLAAATVPFTITIANQGSVPSGAYTVSDTLPEGLTFVSSVPTPTSNADGTMTWSMPSLASGAQTTIDLTVSITDFTAPQPMTNSAEITADSAEELYLLTDVDSEPDPAGAVGNDGPADNTDIGQAGGPGDAGNDDADVAAVSLTGTIDYDLALVKVASNATEATQTAPGTIEYTITVVNQGNVPSGAYTVTDTLPAGVSPTGWPAGGTVAGSILTWAGANLAPGADAAFVVTVQIDDVNQRPFRNVAEISADSADAIYGVADVDSIPNTITTDDNIGNGVPDGDGYGPIGAPVNDNLDPTDAGTGNDGQDDADIADVDFPLSGYGYDLALAKTADTTSTSFDGTIGFTVTVQNQGVLDSREFTVVDRVPAGLSVDPTTISNGGVLAADGTTVTWVVDDLAPAARLGLTFAATISDITLRPYRNQAEITADSAATYSRPGDEVVDVDSTPDTDPGNDVDGLANGYDTPGVDNTGDDPIDQAGEGDDPEDDADIADVTVDVLYDLALIKTGPLAMSPTGDVTFTVTVANQGNVPSGEYEVTDVVPAGMAASDASDGGDLTDPSVVTWSLPSIDPGETKELTVTMHIVDIDLRPFTNVAEITADSADEYSTETVTVTDVDSTPGDGETSGADNTMLDEAGVGDVGEGGDEGFDDEDVAVVTTGVEYDLELAKTVSPTAITPDGSATFTVTVFNHGNVPSGAVTVTDALPAGLAVGAMSDGGTLSPDLTTITWNLAGLDVGATKDLTVTVTVADFNLRPFRNVAEITSDSAAQYGEDVTDIDSTPGDSATSDADNGSIGDAGGAGDDGFDDEDPAVLAGDVRYDLALVKTLAPGQDYGSGSPIDFTIAVANQGNVASGPYSVQDALPAGMSFVAASDGGSAAGGVVTWADLPSLAPGETASLTVTARLDDPTMNAYVNTAEVTSDGSAAYDTPTEDVHDVDSAPDGDLGNDPLIDADDVNVAVPGDEDDHDVAALDVGEVRQANPPAAPPSVPDETAPPAPPSVPGELPRTGGNNGPLQLLAALLVAVGAALFLARRRPPRTP